MRAQNNIILICLLILGLLPVNSFAAGSDEGQENYRVVKFDLGRKNWEDFNISFDIVDSKFDNLHMSPSKFKIELYGENGTLLHTYRSTKFSVDDANMGSGEKLRFVLIAEVNGELIRSEAEFAASAKNMLLSNNAHTPIENLVAQNGFTVNCKLQRAKFSDNSRWETIGSYHDVSITLYSKSSKSSDYRQVPLIRTGPVAQGNLKYIDDLKAKLVRDELKTKEAGQYQHFYQFNCDRISYLVDGETENFTDKGEQSFTVVKSLTDQFVQRLVTMQDLSIPGQTASAEK